MTGGVVEYDGKTYTMTGGQLAVNDGTITTTYTGGDTVNILEPEGASSAYVQLAAGEAIDLAEGIDVLANADEVIYGTSDAYDSNAVVATLTNGAEEGSYLLLADDGTEVDASGLEL